MQSPDNNLARINIRQYNNVGHLVAIQLIFTKVMFNSPWLECEEMGDEPMQLRSIEIPDWM